MKRNSMCLSYRVLICHDIYGLIVVRLTWRVTNELDSVGRSYEYVEFCVLFSALVCQALNLSLRATPKSRATKVRMVILQTKLNHTLKGNIGYRYYWCRKLWLLRSGAKTVPNNCD